MTEEAVDIERYRNRTALTKWRHECRARLKRRYPKIDFDSSLWPVNTLYATKTRDVRLSAALADFTEMDPSFTDAMRCIVAELVLDDSLKELVQPLNGFRLLAKARAQTLFDISLQDVRQIELDRASFARANPESGQSVLVGLTHLSRHLDHLSKRGVIPPTVYTVGRALRSEVVRLHTGHTERRRAVVITTLDHRIEALCVAMNALFSQDPRLSTADRAVIACMGLEMCAPSRVNEILCMAIDDHVTLDDYAVGPDGRAWDALHQAHQMLIVTMKGSKGSQWGAKPVLNFLIDLFNHCLNVIMEHGKRSRMLAAWYEKNPAQLYLPPELEHLRGKDITQRDLWRLMNLRNVADKDVHPRSANLEVFRALRDKIITVPNPRSVSAARDGRSTRPFVQAIPWDQLEPHLLARVQKAMSSCRRVTHANHFNGALSRMLFLFDFEECAYLPDSLKYRTITLRLWQSERYKADYQRRKGAPPEPTLFEKLGITMPVNGVVQIAEISTHDPRRWLTTQAILHREKLSDVLINKWARRLSIEQLEHYDFRTPRQKADQSAMPELMELKDLGAGIEAIQGVEEAYGLKAEIVAVHDAGISVTSMDAIAAAVDNRPVARTSEHLFIIYPSWYGACMHQHHETPCRAYSSCLPCNNNLVVKGHIPTNDAIRERKHLLHRSIVEQIEKLVLAHNRGVPDNPETLEAHLSAIVTKGLNPEEMANSLIDKFHEVKHLVKDVCFANKLEEAFVASGFVVRLDDPNVPSGALIKYHNPTRHAAPGAERALEAHGGHAKIAQGRGELIKRYPQFAPTSLGLTDQRMLMAPDDGNEAEDDEQ